MNAFELTMNLGHNCAQAELTDNQWDCLYRSILHRLKTDEMFRSDVAGEMTDTFTLEEYEEWLGLGMVEK